MYDVLVYFISAVWLQGMFGQSMGTSMMDFHSLQTISEQRIFFNNFTFACFDKCFYFHNSFEVLAVEEESQITFSENMFVITRNEYCCCCERRW